MDRPVRELHSWDGDRRPAPEMGGGHSRLRARQSPSDGILWDPEVRKAKQLEYLRLGEAARVRHAAGHLKPERQNQITLLRHATVSPRAARRSDERQREYGLPVVTDNVSSALETTTRRLRLALNVLWDGIQAESATLRGELLTLT